MHCEHALQPAYRAASALASASAVSDLESDLDLDWVRRKKVDEIDKGSSDMAMR